MLEDTKTSAEPKAHRIPIVLDADMSNDVASITPNVRGSRDMYVLAEYETPKSKT